MACRIGRVVHAPWRQGLVNRFNVIDHDAHVFQPGHVFNGIIAERLDHFFIQLVCAVHCFHVVEHLLRGIFIALLLLPFRAGR